MVCHAEASPKLQKRAIRNVSILSLVKWETAGADCLDGVGGFLWGSPEEVAGAGPWLWLAPSVWRELSCAGPGWEQDAPVLPLEAVGPHRQLDLAVREGFLLFQQADSHSLHTQLSLDVAILRNPQVCSCHVSFLFLSSPCCPPHQSCQCIQCTACLYSLWSSRTCGYSKEQP